jgi:hypothetical protein
MRKIIALLLAAVICAGAATAQIIRTESHSITVMENKKPKVDHGHNFLVKAGAGFMVDEGDTKVKYSAIFGYQKQFTGSGLYWGAQAGLNAIMYDGYDEWSWFYIHSAPAISLGPTFGIKRALGLNTTFDSHIGVGYACAFPSDDDGDDKHRVIWEVGAGVWFNRFLVELEYQGSHGYVTDNGLLLNVGFKF